MHVVVSTLNAKFIHMNLAIRYLKAFVQAKYNVEIAEYTIKDPVMNIAIDLFNRKPDVLGFSCYIWNIEETIKVIKLVKKIMPNVTIVLGGPEVSYDVPYWLKRIPEADFIVIGEGEETFKQLLDEINGAQNFSAISGIGFMADGKIHINPPGNKLDLRKMPSPFRFKEDIPDLPNRIVYVETSRGCPFQCQFCLSSIEVGVRYFNREKIKDDIRYLMKHGAKTIKFVDRTFNISRSYAMDMFQFLIEEHQPGTVFQFEITADIMRPEVIEFLNREAPPGLFRFEIGVQSTNDVTNKLVKRKQNFAKLTRTVTMIKEGGKIDQHLDLIAGLPEEDYQSFRKTFNDVFALRPEELQLGFLKMLRGTGLRINAEKYGYIYMDHAPYEILQNHVLDFADIVKIKQVEDVLEKYWNDHRMDQTIEFLVSSVFPSPFDFFQSFGSYWEKQNWSRIGHQLEDLFLRLKEFLESEQVQQWPIIEGLMKYDFLINTRYKPRKPWWKTVLKKKERAAEYARLLEEPDLLGERFARLHLEEKDLYKHTILEKIPFDLEQYFQTGKIVESPSFLLVYYQPETGKPTPFFLKEKEC